VAVKTALEGGAEGAAGESHIDVMACIRDRFVVESGSSVLTLPIDQSSASS
jgi:hypothetical protein